MERCPELCSRSRCSGSCLHVSPSCYLHVGLGGTAKLPSVGFFFCCRALCHSRTAADALQGEEQSVDGTHVPVPILPQGLGL